MTPRLLVLLVILVGHASVALCCRLGEEGSSGCSEAPECDNVGKCTEKEMTCVSYKWTECRGCFLGAPTCPADYTCEYIKPDRPDFVHKGGGAFCNLACCYRVGKRTLRRKCPKTGDCDGGGGGAVIGIIVGAVVVVLAVVAICLWWQKSKKSGTKGAGVTPGVYAPSTPAGTVAAPAPTVQVPVPTVQVPASTVAAPVEAAPASFDPNTGKPIISQPSSAFCPQCGAKNEGGGKFCMSCGAPLT